MGEQSRVVGPGGQGEDEGKSLKVLPRGDPVERERSDLINVKRQEEEKKRKQETETQGHLQLVRIYTHKYTHTRLLNLLHTSSLSTIVARVSSIKKHQNT